MGSTLARCRTALSPTEIQAGQRQGTFCRIPLPLWDLLQSSWKSWHVLGSESATWTSIQQRTVHERGREFLTPKLTGAGSWSLLPYLLSLWFLNGYKRWSPELHQHQERQEMPLEMPWNAFQVYFLAINCFQARGDFSRPKGLEN